MDDLASEYTVQVGTTLIPDGGLYLKVITKLTEADTMGTISTYVDRLTDLPAVMVKHDSDIDLFHHEVASLRTSLAARKHQVDPTQLMLSLFKGYAACTDATFVAYMERKKSDFEDGTLQFTPSKLMAVATNKYNTLKAQNVWKETPEHEKKIHALEARIASMKTDTRSKPSVPPRNGTRQSTGDRKEKRTAAEQLEQWQSKQARWKLEHVGPTTTRNGKTFHWCEHHQAYCRHKTEECTLCPSGSAPSPTERQPPRARPSGRTPPLVPEGSTAAANTATAESGEDDRSV